MCISRADNMYNEQHWTKHDQAELLSVDNDVDMELTPNIIIILGNSPECLKEKIKIKIKIKINNCRTYIHPGGCIQLGGKI